MGVKSIETRHYEERDAFFGGLRQLSRRSFFKLAGVSAAAALGVLVKKGTTYAK